MTAPGRQAVQLDRLVERWAVARGQLAARALDVLLPLWRGLDVYDGPAVEDFASTAASTSLAAQVRARQLQEAYLRAVLLALDVRLDPTPLVPAEVEPARLDVDPLEVFTRPAITKRYERSRDEVSDGEAEARAQRRLELLVDTDITLAGRDTAREVLRAAADPPAESAARVIGYRRVLRPELSKGGSCGLCIAASDRLYFVEDLLPIHDRDNCVPMPVTEDNDPGMRINGEDLQRLYADAGSTAGEQLKRTRYRVEQHGELGPVLVRAGDRFTGAEQAARRTGEPQDLDAA